MGKLKIWKLRQIDRKLKMGNSKKIGVGNILRLSNSFVGHYGTYMLYMLYGARRRIGNTLK